MHILHWMKNKNDSCFIFLSLYGKNIHFYHDYNIFQNNFKLLCSNRDYFNVYNLLIEFIFTIYRKKYF